MTEIFTTKKLEKIINKKIENNDLIVESILGNWNATIIYIAKKKCLLFVNSETFFSVIIPRFSMKDIDKIDELFINCFYNQLLFEKINIDFKTISSILGKISFHPTNNNKKVIGVLNYNVEKINYFKYDYPILNSSIIRKMTHKLNITPFKQLGWKLPCETMVAKLNIESEKVN
ncbi:hypothetical protein SAMN05216503_0832 [Polaribacter sp. KT25b]|uniref:DUF6933 domain-containing protein n=1 Tax=Polaribacter sp. KT25b TaxID=1855336 RepID=UPI000879E5CD|nr:hypothetical protein [Polaribacter sp. KT25b]SDR77128.1 hypothetical protein SAMN05216503_0832 [Polaribacter sp. KT25b]